MLPALTYFLATALGAIAENSPECMKVDNQASYFQMNEACYNTGTCISFTWPTGDTYEDGTCECCDPFDSTSFCYNTGWLFGAYSGTKCIDFTQFTYALMMIVLHIDEWNPSGEGWMGRANEIECAQGSDGLGVDVEIDWDAGPPFVPLNAAPNPDLLPFVQSLINEGNPTYPDLQSKGYENWNGIIRPWKPSEHAEHCRICLGTSPCKVCTNNNCEEFGPEDQGGHIMISYATDYNTYYNGSCARLDNHIPQTTGQGAGCTANQDIGQAANVAWDKATLGTDGSTTLATVFSDQVKRANTEQIGSTGYPVNGFGWTPQISLERFFFVVSATLGKLVGPVPLPTLSPTKAPTRTPTQTPVADLSCFGAGYTHPVDSLNFVGISEDYDTGCRHGLEPTWPGGNTANFCGSPYVTCLPEENTPSGYPMRDGTIEAYLSSTAKYTVDQCKRECAYDQRCMGFEFWTDVPDTHEGRCSLLDDLPIEIGTSANGVIVDETTLNAETNWHNLGGRICYSKDMATTCHPYFTHADWDAESRDDDGIPFMMKCYCPNNRKGFYTKKVTRSFPATTYCGVEQNNEITNRIKEAQANRMFHLCENWCLFDTQTPRTMSWYHDPWAPAPCWREQYAGIGTHRSYCYRVIRDPFTIEQFYIDQRASNMCSHVDNSAYPTASPVALSDVTYSLAAEGDSCDDECESEGKRCALDHTNMMTKQWADTVASDYENTQGQSDSPFKHFISAGQVCTNDPGVPTEGAKGWAFPGVDAAGNCVVRNDDNDSENPDLDLATPCNLSIGVGYRRLCACTSGSD